MIHYKKQLNTKEGNNEGTKEWKIWNIENK